MKTTVIIVTFNRADDLREALKCLSIQTRPPDEVIVVDNNSTDRTLEVAREFQRSLALKYFLETRQGIAYARNTGIEHAKNEIVVFTDDDCRPAPNWLEELVTPFYRDPKIGQVGGEILPLENPRSIVEEFCNDDAIMRVNPEYDPDLQ
jgi:glycosyltransferase involved in cell wall biosynthesis